MNGFPPQKVGLPPLATTALAMLGLLFLFEWTKQLVFPGIGIWQSHALTILFGTVLAISVAWFVLRKQAALHHQVEEVKWKALAEAQLRLQRIVASSPAVLYSLGVERDN